MNKYIAYCRKSTDEKDKQVLSIESQIEELKEFALRENLQIVKFITESKTAKIPGRVEFNQLIQLIEVGEIQGILAWHPDRLARNSIDGGQIIYLLDTGKLLDLKFPTFWFDNTPQGKFMISMAFSEAKYYVDNLSENVKRGNRQKLRRGDWPNKAPLGYVNNKADKTIVVDPVRAKFIAKAFRLFATGRYTYVDIQRFLSQNKVFSRAGKPIHLDSISRRILTNPFYYGLMNFGGELFPGNHQPLISKKLFDQCQKIVTRHSRRENSIKSGFDFLGLIKCQECDSQITAETHAKFYPRTNNRVAYTYYRCSKKKGKCNQRYIPKQELETQIRQIIQKVSLTPTAYKKFLLWLEKDRQEAKLKSQVEINGTTENLKAIETKLDRLLNAYLDQLIDPQSYQDKKNELIEAKVDFQEQLKEINSKGNTWLEPFSEWSEQAFHAWEILRAKNNGPDLAIGAKTVSSNLFLQNQKLLVDYASPGWNVFASRPTHAKNYPKNPNLLPDMDSNHEKRLQRPL